jgi:hypothetical protein
VTFALARVRVAWALGTSKTAAHGLVAHRLGQPAATALLFGFIFFTVWKASLHIFVGFGSYRRRRFGTRRSSLFASIDVFIQTHQDFLKLHRHLFNAAPFLVSLPFSSLIGPFTPDIRAQKLFLRPARLPFGFFSVTGALRFDPVARLCFALPFAVNPAPRDLDSFSPRPTERLTDIPVSNNHNHYKNKSTVNLQIRKSSFSQKIYIHAHNM